MIIVALNKVVIGERGFLQRPIEIFMACKRGKAQLEERNGLYLLHVV